MYVWIWSADQDTADSPVQPVHNADVADSQIDGSIMAINDEGPLCPVMTVTSQLQDCN